MKNENDKKMGRDGLVFLGIYFKYDLLSEYFKDFRMHEISYCIFMYGKNDV